MSGRLTVCSWSEWICARSENGDNLSWFDAERMLVIITNHLGPRDGVEPFETARCKRARTVHRETMCSTPGSIGQRAVRHSLRFWSDSRRFHEAPVRPVASHGDWRGTAFPPQRSATDWMGRRGRHAHMLVVSPPPSNSARKENSGRPSRRGQSIESWKVPVPRSLALDPEPWAAR